MTAYLTIIVGIDANHGIGVDNKLPWRLPEDMAFFKRTTTGHPVIMGRKTYDSIGRPLPNRRNIVITRNADWHPVGVESVNSLDAALALLGADGSEEAFVIGGTQIYELAMARADRLLVTEIRKSFDCDAFFPQIDPGQWQEVGRESFHSDAGGFDYAFVTYDRASPKLA